ncbi:MAG: hypothetical protein KDI36_12140 [Pseudomonadales bacterium]|nr:hypothetical protein [Pseudomonadales bacterium]
MTRLFYVPGEQRWQDEALAFWARHAALNEADARQRAPQLAAIALDDAGKLQAVATLAPALITELQQYLLLFRCFVAPAMRRQGIARELLSFSWHETAARIHEPATYRFAGIAASVPAELAKQTSPDLVWKHSLFFLARKNGDGSQLRLRYFENVHIQVPATVGARP